MCILKITKFEPQAKRYCKATPGLKRWEVVDLICGGDFWTQLHESKSIMATTIVDAAGLGDIEVSTLAWCSTPFIFLVSLFTYKSRASCKTARIHSWWRNVYATALTLTWSKIRLVLDLWSSALWGNCMATNAISAIYPKFGHTALHESARNGHDNIIQLLLEHKANPKLLNDVMNN